MTDLLPPWPLFAAFLAASVALALTPGPGVFYVVTRSVLHGRRSGLVSVAGVALGNFGNALAAALGLAAVFATSALAFDLVRYAGAAYLAWLGVQTLRAARAGAPPSDARALDPKRVFRDGCVVALFNPKTTLFFAAFLPQFVTGDAPVAPRTLALGTIFVVIAAVTDALYAITAARIGPALAGASRVAIAGRLLGGAAFIGLALVAALGGPRSSQGSSLR